MEVSRPNFVRDVNIRLPDLEAEVGMEGHGRVEWRVVLECEARVQPTLTQEHVKREVLNKNERLRSMNMTSRLDLKVIQNYIPSWLQ